GGLDDVALRHADELMWAERSEAREEGGALLFVDATFPAPRLIVFGAVDFAAALVRLARGIGWRPYVVDPRSRFATVERFPDAELERLAAPTGLDLGATSSEETALSILAEVVAVRNGREGGRLARAGGRIHEVGA